MFRMRCLQIILCVVMTGTFATGCSGESVEEAPLQMPFKENTWVRKETVSKSKEQMFDSANKSLPALPVDASLAKKLNSVSTSSTAIKNEKDCLVQVNELDKRRTAVQERGGVWHIFESVAAIKEYTNYGMQLDSQINRLVFSLKHLCRATKGMPLNGWGRTKVEELKKYGKEKMRQTYIELGNPAADVDIWLKYAETAIESRKRNIPFAKVNESVSRSANMVTLYEELSLTKVDESTKKTFYSDASTLLSVINESFTSDPNIALSIEDENLFPSNDLEAEL